MKTENEKRAALGYEPDPHGDRYVQDPKILDFFKADHLREPLKSVSGSFCALAHELVERLPDSAERSVALRKLLEAKDAACRAALP